jgi:hypothetical protein
MNTPLTQTTIAHPATRDRYEIEVDRISTDEISVRVTRNQITETYVAIFTADFDIDAALMTGYVAAEDNMRQVLRAGA